MLAASRGLVLVELLVVVAIVAILMAFSVFQASQFEGAGKEQIYEADLEEAAALIVKARSYARVNRFDDHWGVKLLTGQTTDCGTTSEVGCFVLFKGNDYISRDSNYDEYVTISEDLHPYTETNNEEEIYWQKVTGWGRGFNNASSSDATGFRLVNTDGNYDCTIKVTIFGLVYNSCGA